MKNKKIQKLLHRLKIGQEIYFNSKLIKKNSKNECLFCGKKVLINELII